MLGEDRIRAAGSPSASRRAPPSGHKRMKRYAPTAIAPSQLSRHPAVRAWRALGEPAPSLGESLRAARSKPSLFRLAFGDSGTPAVFAKRFRRDRPALERTVYQEVLSRLALPTPRCRGWHEDADGSGWLFIEDVGGRELSEADPQDRVLAARWLGRLHREGSSLPQAAALPEAGAPRYLAQMHAGRAEIHRNLGNPALSTGDRAVLDRVLRQQEEIESRWPSIERACQALPVTLVHGDFQEKNLRVLEHRDGPTLCAMDWEMAGWGIPAADLGNADGGGLSMAIDPDAYRATVGDRWPALDDGAMDRLTVLGGIFQGIAAVEWSASTLRFEDPRYLLKPVTSMDLYERKTAAALDRAGAWLS